MPRNPQDMVNKRFQEKSITKCDDLSPRVKVRVACDSTPVYPLPPIDCLKLYEGPFTWFKAWPLKFNEIENGLTVLEETFTKGKSETDSLLKSSGMKLISKKGTQVFFLAETRKFNQAEKSLEEGREFIETCLVSGIFTEEYGEGFKHVFDGLRIYLKVQSGVQSFVHSPPSIEHSKLCAKSKVAVSVMRDFFIEDCRKSALDRPDYMLKILEVEPYIIKWHFHLYGALRSNRKLKPRPAPYGHERIIVDDPLSLSYVSLYLAEILMVKGMKEEESPGAFPLSFGNLTFNSPEDILAVILEKTMYLLTMNCNLAEVYLILSEVHVYKIPESFQKRDIALACLKRVLRLCPDSPRGLYRMGLFQLKSGNHKEAAIYLKKLVCLDNELSIGALFALLQILMANPVKNEVEILSLFKCIIGNRLEMIKKVCGRFLSMFYYLKGCFHFMLEGKDEEAIASWIFAQETCGGRRSYHFLNLQHQIETFGWTTTKLNLPNISKSLKQAAYIEQVHFKQILLEMCFEVDDVIRKQWERTNGWIKYADDSDEKY